MLFFLSILFLCSCVSHSPVGGVQEIINNSPSAPLVKKEEPFTGLTRSEPVRKTPEIEVTDDEQRKAVSQIENLSIGEVIRIEEPNTQNLYDNSRYDFPITMNSRVEGWMDYFTGRGRPHMERYLSRSSRYLPLMKAILKKSGLPEDLVYLALIESGFSMKARSRARAVGPWQFMAATGRRYGLTVNAWIDERRDPIRSTEAASRYLKDLYLMFESWYLAASAYNAGEYKILRAVEELHTNNYWRICETGFLRRETRDYIPKLIAAAIIGKNAEKYGFGDLDYQDPLDFETMTIDFPVHLKEIARISNVSADEIEELNPELTRNMIPPGLIYEIRVPIGSRALVERALASYRVDKPAPEIPKQVITKKGDTLANLARRYRVRTKDLLEANNLNSKERLEAGMSLIIPSPVLVGSRKKTIVADRVLSSATKNTSDSRYISHLVKKGESLWSIAEKYNVTVADLFRWNQLKRSRIQAGKSIKIKSG